MFCGSLLKNKNSFIFYTDFEGDAGSVFLQIPVNRVTSKSFFRNTLRQKIVCIACFLVSRSSKRVIQAIHI